MSFQEQIEEFPPRQLEACALRFVSTPPTPYRKIAASMGITLRAAVKLVKKGSPRWRAINGETESLPPQASAA